VHESVAGPLRPTPRCKPMSASGVLRKSRNITVAAFPKKRMTVGRAGEAVLRFVQVKP